MTDDVYIEDAEFRRRAHALLVATTKPTIEADEPSYSAEIDALIAAGAASCPRRGRAGHRAGFPGVAMFPAPGTPEVWCPCDNWSGTRTGRHLANCPEFYGDFAAPTCGKILDGLYPCGLPLGHQWSCCGFRRDGPTCVVCRTPLPTPVGLQTIRDHCCAAHTEPR